MEKIEIKEDESIKYDEVLKTIFTKDTNMSVEDYEKMLDAVSKNYDELNDTKGTKPSLEERRERIKANYYGTSINFLFQILNTVNQFARNYSLLIEEIARKVGVDFEKIETEEDKAMKAAAKYLEEGALKRKAERENLEKQNLNREQRRKVKKETGEIIKFQK